MRRISQVHPNQLIAIIAWIPLLALFLLMSEVSAGQHDSPRAHYFALLKSRSIIEKHFEELKNNTQNGLPGLRSAVESDRMELVQRTHLTIEFCQLNLDTLHELGREINTARASAIALGISIPPSPDALLGGETVVSIPGEITVHYGHPHGAEAVNIVQTLESFEQSVEQASNHLNQKLNRHNLGNRIMEATLWVNKQQAMMHRLVHQLNRKIEADAASNAPGSAFQVVRVPLSPGEIASVSPSQLPVPLEQMSRP